ncbi:MAG: hypothetical protein LBH79_02365 [Nitrososphaerota archaeon]|nr:hypothetical protein [Nitrososphaerota archaeon]
MRRFALVAILLTVLIAVSAVGVLGEISSGVKSGDWISYTVNVSGQPPVDHDLKSASINVLEAKDAALQLSVTSEFINGTIFTEQINLNLAEGILGDVFFIPSNLNKDDQFYDIYQGNITITREQTRMIAGAERQVVLGSTVATNCMWDRETGALVYARTSQQNYTLETRIDQTNMWPSDIFSFNPSTFYTLISVVIVLIAILATLSAIWIKQKKQKPLLLALQIVGALFVTVFLFAYIGGMFMTPSTTVLHSELPVRITLFVSGAALLTLILTNAIMALREKTLKSSVMLKVGLLIVAAAYFLFTLHALFNLEWIGEWDRFASGSISTIILIQDSSAFVGVIARFIAGIIAIAGVGLYFRKGLPSTQSLYRILRWILMLEAIYWFALIPTAVTLGYLAAVLYGSSAMGLAGNLVWTTIPLFVESMVLPAALIVLAKKLDYKKPSIDAIRWAWISGVLLIVVFWLTNMGTWMLTVSTKGFSYLVNYPQNMFSFILTVGGLIGLALSTVYFAKKRGLSQSWQTLNLRGVGAIITLLGLFFLWNYLSWIFFGGNYIWSDWYAWFLGHNLDLWMLSLPLVGIPLMLYRSDREPAGV